MNQEEFQLLIKKYRQGRCTPGERKIIDDWYNSISTGKETFADEKDEETLKKRSWAAVDQVITRTEEKDSAKTKVLHFKRWAPIGIAASIVLCLACVIWINANRTPIHLIFTGTDPSSQKTIDNEGTKPLSFSLPDGSRITLFPGSSIRYSTALTDPRREVFLEGEAFFDVARNAAKPFLVYTNELTTEVLGTRFLVKAYNEHEEVVVTVKSGKVSVYPNIDNQRQSKYAEPIVLTPNQQAIYYPGETTTVKKLVEEPEVILPKATAKHRYVNAPVNDILRSLVQDYGIEIQYDSILLSNCSLTSDLSEEGFYEQIEILCNALGAEYQVSENAVMINATGCNTTNIFP